MALPISSIETLARSRMTDTLSKEGLARLREGLATCHPRQGLTPQAREAIVALAREARANGCAPERLLIAVKDVCYTSPEIFSLTTTAERDTFLAKVVTACIKEFYRVERGD